MLAWIIENKLILILALLIILLIRALHSSDVYASKNVTLNIENERLRKSEKTTKEEIASLKKLLEDSRQKRRDLSKRIDNLESKRVEELEKFRKYYQDRIINLSAELDESRKAASVQEQTYNRRLETIRELEQKLDTLRVNRDIEIASLKREHKETCKRKDNLLNSIAKEKDAMANEIENRNSYYKKMLEGNLTAIPYLAGLIADYLTYDYEVLAKHLDWGSDQKRLKKVADIREIRQCAREQIEEAKEAEYQLEYLKRIYPEIEDIIDTDYKELNVAPTLDENHVYYDRTRDYLDKEEWACLSESKRSQLALDRYVEGYRKSKWQIGRDYELYVGYSMYEKNGKHVRYFGSEKRLEDLGRDLIVESDSGVDIVQCKYWSKEKTIHEKHIFQLYGTTILYKLEHNTWLPVNPIFVTNIKLSDKAKEVAEYLEIKVIENYELGDFPRIKCNVNYDASGNKTKIYHLPMDQMYDNVIIDKSKGEFFAMTVKDAEDAGFRRAMKWMGEK